MTDDIRKEIDTSAGVHIIAGNGTIGDIENIAVNGGIIGKITDMSDVPKDIAVADMTGDMTMTATDHVKCRVMATIDVSHMIMDTVAMAADILHGADTVAMAADILHGADTVAMAAGMADSIATAIRGHAKGRTIGAAVSAASF